MRPLVVTFAGSGTGVAQRIAEMLGGDVRDGDAASIRRAFVESRAIIGVCAAGILIRIVAPLIADKHAEPPVIAVSQDGSQVVPLLGGHHGANAMAREIAAGLGGTAALTTASDARFARALDDPPPGWVLGNSEAVKPAVAAVLAGASIRLQGQSSWLAEAGYPIDPNGQVEVFAGIGPVPNQALGFHPQVVVAGVGCERGTSTEEIVDLINETLVAADASPKALAALATIDIKSDEAGLNAAAAHFGVPLRLFSAAELAAERERLPNPSSIVEAEVGTPGVAEAAALKAGALLVSKRKSRRATCALGLAPAPIAIEAFGRGAGQLHIVGIGPGDAMARTDSAVAALDASADWVGYGLYIDLIADLRFGQQEHRFALGDEEVRVRHALELAGEGKVVSLVCSGDGQIYAMAALVYELLEAAGDRGLSDAARRVAVAAHPGISALQAASARAGALLGHDFCAISLSDLLTPRQDIERRLEAAAQGDFVTALYNPRSQRRTDLIERAKAVMLRYRPAETPVIVATNLGRPGEEVAVTTLAAFDPAAIGMLSIVLIGSSESRAFRRGDGRTVAYTPRGYARKAEAAE